MNRFLILIFMAGCSNLFAQTDTSTIMPPPPTPEKIAWMDSVANASHTNPEELKSMDEVFSGEADQQPQFPGGEAEMMQWISNNLKYPVAAVEDSIQGKVYVEFIVEQDGTLTNIRILRSPSDILSKEVERMVRTMPNWSPGTYEGQITRVKYVLPVQFTL